MRALCPVKAWRVFVGLLLFGTFSAQAAPVLYATGVGTGPGAGLSALYTVNPDTGASILLWNFSGIHIYAGGLAYDASTDSLYATGVEDSSTGTSRLFSISRFTGAVTTVGAVGDNINLSSGGLAINPVTGVMYATGGNGFQSTGLFTIDKTSGIATLIGQSGGQYPQPLVHLNGLGFRSDGVLFANGLYNYAASSLSNLLSVDLVTGVATDIGPHGVTLGRQLAYSGLAFRDDGTLLSLGSLDAASGALYAVDTLTGAATSLSGMGLPYGTGPIHFGVDGGLTFAPATAVPAPATLWLLGSGVLGLIGAARKRMR